MLENSVFLVDFFPSSIKKIAHFWVFEDNFDLAVPLPTPCLEKTKNEGFFLLQASLIVWWVPENRFFGQIARYFLTFSNGLRKKQITV